MLKNNFFESKGPFMLKELFEGKYKEKETKILNVKTLSLATKNDITFFDSLNYKNFASKTNAAFCITTEKLKENLPNTCTPVVVKNVLSELAKVTKKFYPDADIDYPDKTLVKPKTSKYSKVKFGNNVLIGKNVKLGKNTSIGNNTIIEHDVVIGKNCVIGSQVMIKNSIIGDDVIIQYYIRIKVMTFKTVTHEKIFKTKFIHQSFQNYFLFAPIFI